MDLASLIFAGSRHANNREDETDSSHPQNQPASQRPPHVDGVVVPVPATQEEEHLVEPPAQTSEKPESNAKNSTDSLRKDEAPPLPRYDLLYSSHNLSNSIHNQSDSAGPQINKNTNTPVELADRVHSQEDILMGTYYSGTERRAPPRVYSANRLRQREWQDIRKRWQRRKYDFRQEVDVGNAMAIQIQQSREFLASSFNKEQQKGRSKKKRGDNSLLPVNREAELLSQLTQSDEQDQPQPQQPQQKQTVPPYKETMNYWEYGLHVPNEIESIVHDIGAIPETATVNAAKGNQRQPTTKAWQLRSFKRPIRCHRLTSELTALHNDPIRSRPVTLQRRQVFRAAARYLVSSAAPAEADAGSVSLGARWIRILWKLQHRRAFSPAPSLPQPPQHNQRAHDDSMSANQVWNDANLLSNHQCRRTGSFLYQFLTHTWTNRAAAAHRLFGLQQPLLLLPPGPEADWVGLSMEPRKGDALERVVWSECRSRYSRDSRHPSQEQPMEWKPVATAAMTSGTGPGTPLLEPTTLYLHLPGTRPPVPCFPCDVIPLQFGPSDRYEQVMHEGIIDTGVYKLTLATLLTRLAATVVTARTKSRNYNDDSDSNDDFEQQHRHEQAVTGLQQQLRAVLEQTVRLNQNKFYELIRRKVRMNALELPLAFYYRSLATYCSLVANGVPVPIHRPRASVSGKDDVSDHVVDSKEDSDDFGELAGAPSLQTVVKHLFEILDVNLEHNGLRMFAELHLTFGILRLAHRLPAHSLQLLSRPLECDSTTTSEILTPFDIVRDVLEDLERRDILVDHVAGILAPGALDDDGESAFLMYAGELEYSLHRASTIFAHCVERDPTQVMYQAWHLAAVAGSLLLCSGQCIGFSTSHPYPSERTTSYIDDDGTNGEASSAPHEARRCLPKFSDLRRETVIVFRRLAHLARYQRGNRAHRLLATFLEWRQVMALLLGPPSRREVIGRDRSCYRNIRELHRYHCTEWALEERTTSALESVLLNDRLNNNIDCDNHDDHTKEQRRLHGFACALEGDPSSLHHWRTLVQALGPVRRRVPQNSEDPQVPDTIVSNNMTVDLVREDTEDGWWGFERKWWHECLLQPPQVATIVSRVSEDRANEIVGDIQSKLVDIEPLVRDSSDVGLKMDRNSREPSSLEWLEKFLMDRPSERDSDDDSGEEVDDETIPPPVELRSRSVDQYLPRATRQPTQRAAYTSSPKPTFPLELIADNDPGHGAELLAYKALILSHLCSECHGNVNRLVFILVHASLNETAVSKRGNASRCVQWLYQMGLDVTTGYRHVLLDPAKFKLDSSAATVFLKSRRHQQLRAVSGKRKRARKEACAGLHEERSTTELGSTEMDIAAASPAKKARKSSKGHLIRQKKMSTGRVQSRKKTTVASRPTRDCMGKSSVASFQLQQEELPGVLLPTHDEHAAGVIIFEI